MGYHVDEGKGARIRRRNRKEPARLECTMEIERKSSEEKNARRRKAGKRV